MDNDYSNDETQDVKEAVNRMALEASRTAHPRAVYVREEDVYRRPEVADFEERGTEAQVAQLYAALAAARGSFGEIRKTRKVEIKSKDNRVLYPFTYAPMEELLGATTGPLTANGLVVMMPFVTGHDQASKQLVILAHSAGARLVFKFEFCPAADEKTFGGQTTYLQRYCYRSVLTLAADGDMEEMPTRAGEDSAHAEDVKRPSGSERIQLRNGKAQVAQTAPAPVAINQAHLNEMLTLAKKVGLTKRSQVAEFVWQTLNNGEPFGLGEPFCSSLTEDQLEKCFTALTSRLDRVAGAVR